MTDLTAPGCDLLVISPHTDDAEIGLGGTIARLTRQGRKVWLVDLTRGELASNATPDERWAEADAASRVLGVTGRVQLDLPDGFIGEHDPRQVEAVVGVLRRLRPRWVVTAPDPVRHPDHVATPPLVTRAAFLARLATFTPEPVEGLIWEGGESWGDPADRWVIGAQMHVCPETGAPDLVFDVSDTWDVKMASLDCYPSQFSTRPDSLPTHINTPEFMARVERRGRTWGRRAGCAWGEALCTNAVPVLTDLDQHWAAP